MFSAAPRCAALVALLLAGCQSSVQYDQAAREMRLQEDQLYAMEDYLTQYQQLICKYRAENEALRRQLSDGGEQPMPAPRTPPRVRNFIPPATDRRSIELPETRPTDGAPTEPDLEVPDIPTLDETRASTRNDVESAEVIPASAVAIDSTDRRTVVDNVRLRGEVIENDAGGGPRLAIVVEPFDDAGLATQYDGTLSLMLLGSDPDGGQQSLARWDYSPDDVRAAARSNTGEEAITFHLELPAEMPETESCELWLRLQPREGGKLLAHAAIDLQQPGSFASTGDSRLQRSDSRDAGLIVPEEQAVVAAVYNAALDAAPPLDSEVYDGGWTIARPGAPAGMPKTGEDAGENWRASMESPPTVIASGPAVKPRPPVSRPVSDIQNSTSGAAGSRQPVAWAPNRPGRAAAVSPRTATARPRWSDTR